MEPFDFVLIMVSIIIGLGLTEVLTGIGQQLRVGWRSVYWVHAAAVVLVLLALLNQWWGAWTLRNEADWHYVDFVLYVAGPIILFLISYLAYPQKVSDWKLKEYYYEHSRQFWGLAAMYVIVTMVFRTVAFDWELLTSENLVRLGFLVAALVLASNRNERLHGAGVLLALGLLALYVARFTLMIGRV